jgi:hypothetical protein
MTSGKSGHKWDCKSEFRSSRLLIFPNHPEDFKIREREIVIPAMGWASLRQSDKPTKPRISDFKRLHNPPPVQMIVVLAAVNANPVNSVARNLHDPRLRMMLAPVALQP